MIFEFTVRKNNQKEIIREGHIKKDKLFDYVDLVKSGISDFNDEKRYIATGSLETNKILKFDIITYDSRPSRANMQFKADDVIFAKMKNTEKIFKINDETSNHIYSTGFAELRIKNNLDLLPKYLFYYLLSPCFQVLKDKKCTGTTQKAITNSKLKDFEIYVPSLTMQQETVDLIEKLLPLVDNYGKIEELLEELNNNFPEEIKKSILQEAIQGKLVPQDPNDEPASILLERIKKEKEQLIKDKKIRRNNNESFIYKENNHFYEKIGKNEPVCIDEEIPFDIPYNWEWCRLGEISFITKLAGFEYTKYISPNIQSSGIPLLKAKYIKKDKLLTNFEHYISKELSDELIRSKVNKKCILTPYVGASIGNVICFNAEFEAHLAPNLAKIVMYGNINENYIVNYIKSYFGYKELTKYMKSTAQPSISMAALRDMLVPLPPLNKQKQIVDKIEELFDKLN